MNQEATPFTKELELARRTAAEAAALVAERRGVDEVREKGRADLVTAADEAAERTILASIRDRFPGDGIIAEESAAAGASEGRRWIVDPLDGTVNYVHGHPFVCVSVAFADDDGPAVGVIHAPFLGEVYHATRGGGAFLNDDPIRVSTTANPGNALLATGFPFRKGKGDPETYFRLVAEVVLATHGVRRAGSAALDLAYVASGRVDAFFEIGLGAWDIAAGLLLVAEAGGRVGGWPGDADGPLRTGRVLASNGALHPWLEAAVSRYAPPL